MTKTQRFRPTVLILVAAVAGSILFASIHDENNAEEGSSSLRNNHRRHLMSLVQFADPKSVTLKSDAQSKKRKRKKTTVTSEGDEGDGVPYDEPPAFRDDGYINGGGGGGGEGIGEGGGEGDQLVTKPKREQFLPVDHQSRKKCQIVYITGVEGATHHGFIPIIEALARNQVDPATGLGYEVDINPMSLKAGMFGWYSGKIRGWGFDASPPPDVDDPAFVQRVVAESCPDDGRKHVLVEWASFPSGHEGDKRTYRVHRSHEWLTMSPEEIANTDEALSHPTNMNAFYQSYSPYVDIKYIVLHRPFLETIASHHEWDGGPVTHSNIIRGFMLMLRRFLDTHLYDLVTGRRLWSLVCVERIMAKNYDTEHDSLVARRHVLSYLAEFLDWPDGDCPQCFDGWRESTKDPLVTLGEENVQTLVEHMQYLEGVWPPPGEEGILEQQCGI